MSLNRDLVYSCLPSFQRKKGKEREFELFAFYVYGPALAHLTVKLVPSLDTADGAALVTPLLVTIMIDCTDAPKLPICP